MGVLCSGSVVGGFTEFGLVAVQGGEDERGGHAPSRDPDHHHGEAEDERVVVDEGEQRGEDQGDDGQQDPRVGGCEVHGISDPL